MAAERFDQAKDRIIQVFDYLKALNEHRNPAKRQVKDQIWCLWLDHLPSHSAVIQSTTFEDGSKGDAEPSHRDEDFIPRVKRPELTSPPAPPDEVRPWLKPGWENPDNLEIELLESRNEVTNDGETIMMSFDDEPERRKRLDSWLAKRGQWRLNELPARNAMKVFERLYELHGRLEREGEGLELVLGDGVLSWRREDGGIYHPILLQRVQLVFDPATPEFTITDSDFGTELYTSLFHSVSDVDPQSLAQCRTELEQGDYHPLAEKSSSFFKRFAVMLSSQGEFIDQHRPPVESEHPVIGRSPVLFLRSRTLGFSTAIARSLETIRERNDICTGILNVVGIESAPTWDDEPSTESRSRLATLPERDILFGKESNPEQNRIARRLQKYGAVLVQGPPGTGKSHTIANLIGHLLAEGKNVLVTSHTTKALRVLRSHIIEQLRPLCASVLDNDLDSRRQLEESVTAITNRLSESDAGDLEYEAEQLSETRQNLLSRLEYLNSELLKARTAEYRDIVVAGQRIPSSQAARRIADGRGEHDWIPGPLELGAPLPLSPNEIIELYDTNAHTTPEDDAFVDSPFPAVEELLPPEEFQKIVQTRDELAEQSDSHNKEYWGKTSFTTQHLRDLEKLIRDFRSAIADFRSLAPWQVAVVDAGRLGDAELAPWEHLQCKIKESQDAVSQAKIAAITYAPVISQDMSYEQQRQIARAICDFLESGRRLTWYTLLLKSNWKEAIRAWRVRGARPDGGKS